jgi:peptide subunit release factor 1 (eRF1)
MTTRTQVDALEELLDRLAAFEPGDFPVLSLYLDARADAQGHEGFGPFLRKELKAVARTYPPNAPEREGFDADLERITTYLQTDVLPPSNGVAIFACHAAGLFEAVQVKVAFPEHRLFVGSTPHLYPLAHILDHYRRYAAVVADTNAARIFVFGLGQPLETRDVVNRKVKRHKEGGWSQMHYQRHVDNFHLHHAKEVADVLTRLVRDERLSQVILGGDEVIVPLLRARLPREVDEKVVEVLHLDVRTPEHEILAATFEAFRRHDQRSDADTVRRLLDEFRSRGLGVVGLEDTLAALEAGQVDELVVPARPVALKTADGTPAEESAADALLARALQTGARVTFIEDLGPLSEVGGVGALLRYRLSPEHAVPDAPSPATELEP